MKKKKKSKPRTQVFAKLNTTKVKAFKYYNKEMEETSKKFKEKNKNAFNINFYLFQNMTEILQEIKISCTYQTYNK